MTATRTHITPTELAQQRRVKLDVVYRWISAGELVATDCSARPGGRPRWRISGTALEAFDLRRSSRPAPQMPRIRRRKQNEITQYF